MVVKELLQMSPLRLITALPETTIDEAARRMERFSVGIVVILDDKDGIAGVLSERDIVSALGRKEIVLEETVVGDLMSESVVTVSPNDSIIDAVLAMNTNGIRHLVATEDGRAVGVLRICDVHSVFARQLLDDKGDGDVQLTMDFIKALAA